MQADLLDTRLPVGFELLRTDGTHFCFEVLERVADNAFAARNGNIAARRDCKHTAAHGAETGGAIGSPPAHDGRNQHGQQICMTGQYAKAAALILGPHRRDIAALDEDLRRRRHSEMKGAAHCAAAACFWRSGACCAVACEAFSLSRASSMVPTM